jgi:translocation and assembly module TamB
LTASGNLSLPYAPGGAPWTVALKVDGDLLKTLKLDADSRGYLPARLSGELQPLADNLPAELRITADSFKPSADLPDTLQLNQLDLTAKGDLKNGYQVLGKAVLPAKRPGGPAAARQGRRQGRADRRPGVDGQRPPEPQAQCRAGLAARLQRRGENRLAGFPWHRLYPVIDEPQVVLRTFNGEVSYKDGNYLGNSRPISTVPPASSMWSRRSVATSSRSSCPS